MRDSEARSKYGLIKPETNQLEKRTWLTLLIRATLQKVFRFLGGRADDKKTHYNAASIDFIGERARLVGPAILFPYGQ